MRTRIIPGKLYTTEMKYYHNSNLKLLLIPANTIVLALEYPRTVKKKTLFQCTNFLVNDKVLELKTITGEWGFLKPLVNSNQK